MSRFLTYVLLAGAVWGVAGFAPTQPGTVALRSTACSSAACSLRSRPLASQASQKQCAGRVSVTGLRAATAQTVADMTKKSPWMIVEKKAPRTAFLCNGWKTEAENARNLGWTSSSIETMVRMQREAATADLFKDVMPLLMAKAADEKNLLDNPAATPNPKMANLEIIAAISVGSGSAAGE